MPRIRIPNRFTARHYQKRFMKFYDQGGRFGMWVVHRRGGKDLTSMHQECKEMHDRRGVYWHIFPTMEQGRKAIWEGFTRDGDRTMEQVFPKAIRKSPKEWLPQGEMIVELKCGSIWRLIGSDRMEVVGSGPVKVTFSEYALAKPTGWDLIRPMIRENKGSAAFITTPRGRNHAHTLWEIALASAKAAASPTAGWFAELQTIFDTGAFDDPQSVIDEERAAGMPDALIRQEYLCDWTAALVGSVWGEGVERLEKDGRYLDFEHPNDGVYAVFDLGISDATAIWFFRIGEGLDFIDYYEAHGKGMSHYHDVLEQKGYKYIRIVMPHDARARSLQTGVSILDQSRNIWPGLVHIGPELSLADGIQAGRWLLEQPHTRIHTRCKDGVETLRQYHYEFDEARKVYSGRPEHDWSSHGADAFRYSAIVAKVAGWLKPRPTPPAPKIIVPPAHYAFTLDQLWEIYDDERKFRSGRI